PASAFGPPAAEPPPGIVAETLAPTLTPSLFDLQRQADRVLLSHFSPAGVLINRNLEVLQFRGHTGPYLEHPHGEASLNLLKMAREGLSVDLRTAISRALKTGTRVVHEGPRAKQNGEAIEVNIEVRPFSTP